MIITRKKQLQACKTAAKISTDILAQITTAAKVGVYPIELDNLAFKLCDKYQVIPSFVGVDNGTTQYQHAMCISVNDTVLHGIPSHTKALRPGDIVKLDFGIIYQKLYTDQCVTIGIKHLTPENLNLVEVAKQAVLAAANLALAGNTTGYLGATMETIVKKHGYDVLKNYIGHGIGIHLHEFPEIPAFGHPLRGAILKKGMVICVEAQVVAGSDKTITESDTWSVKTADGQNSAMFEYMVLVGKDKSSILTPTQDWPIIV